MNKDILISVLLPVYRVNTDYLHECIQSLVTQTYSKFELLVLYEPSENDGIRECISSFNDERIKIVETNLKRWTLPASLNVGLRVAKGKYMARMDADDIALPRRFELQLDYMEKHPDIAVLGGSTQYTSGKSHDVGALMTSEERAIRLLFRNDGVAHPTAFFRTDFFRNNNLWYLEDKGGAEDYYLWSQVVICGGRIDCLKDKVLKYRIHDEQIVRRMANKIPELVNEVRIIQVKRYAELTDDEIQCFLDWDYSKEYNHSADQIGKIFNRIIEGNGIRNLYEPKTLKKVFIERWFSYAMTQIKEYHKWDLIRSSFFWKSFYPVNMLYILKHMIYKYLK